MAGNETGERRQAKGKMGQARGAATPWPWWTYRGARVVVWTREHRLFEAPGYSPADRVPSSPTGTLNTYCTNYPVPKTERTTREDPPQLSTRYLECTSTRQEARNQCPVLKTISHGSTWTVQCGPERLAGQQIPCYAVQGKSYPPFGRSSIIVNWVISYPIVNGVGP